MFDRIVVGFDASPTSRRAASWAAQEAVARAADLKLVAAVEEPWYGADAVLPTAAVRALEAQLAGDVAAEVGRLSNSHPTLVVSAVTHRGSPAHVLRTFGRRADLVVVGSIGRAPSSPRDLGATARALAKRSTAPVLVVPRHAATVPPARVLVLVDGSRRDVDVLAAATLEANLFSAELVVVHCLEGDEPRDSTDDVVEHAMHIARRAASGPVGMRLVTGPVTSALTEDAAATLIVVGQHHTLATACARHRSTALGLIRFETVPVLVVPHVADARNPQ